MYNGDTYLQASFINFSFFLLTCIYVGILYGFLIV